MEKKEENEVKKVYDFYYKVASIAKVVLIGLAVLALIGGLASLATVKAEEKDEDYYEEVEDCENCYEDDDAVYYTVGEEDTPESSDDAFTKAIKGVSFLSGLLSAIILVISAIFAEKYFLYKSYTLRLMDEINTSVNKKK